MRATNFPKLNAPLLALITGIIMEALFFFDFELFGTTTQFGTNTNFWSQSFWWFHDSAAKFTDHCVFMGNGIWQGIAGCIIFFSVALCQWWIILLVPIWCIRRFAIK